jgi:hypothetical protein
MATKHQQKVKDGVDMDFVGSRDEQAETRTIESRRRIRTKMDDDIEAFLSQGGKIREIEPHVQADPPTKPRSSYGSRPI